MLPPCKLLSCACKRGHKGECLPEADEMMALWLVKAEGSRQSGKFLGCQTSSHKHFREAPSVGLGKRLWKDPQACRWEEESSNGGRWWGRGASPASILDKSSCTLQARGFPCSRHTLLTPWSLSSRHIPPGLSPVGAGAGPES